MALTGKQKAAMLLMSLDAATAAELLKGIDAEAVQQLAVELAHLNASGCGGSGQSLALAKQFRDSLGANDGFHLGGFLRQMLNSTVGSKESEEIQARLHAMLSTHDPFETIRAVDAQTLACTLKDEHPLATAVVLTELPAAKRSQVLGLLAEGIRLGVAGRMSGCEALPADAKAGMAVRVCKRLLAATKEHNHREQIGSSEQPVRKVAVVLRRLGTDLRDGLLRAIGQRDGQISRQVADLMVVWEDLPQVADEPLREAISRIDTKDIALALVGTDREISDKIRSNIPSDALDALEKQTRLAPAPNKRDVENARAAIVRSLRKMNETGRLLFAEDR